MISNIGPSNCQESLYCFPPLKAGVSQPLINKVQWIFSDQNKSKEVELIKHFLECPTAREILEKILKMGTSLVISFKNLIETPYGKGTDNIFESSQSKFYSSEGGQAPAIIYLSSEEFLFPLHQQIQTFVFELSHAFTELTIKPSELEFEKMLQQNRVSREMYEFYYENYEYESAKTQLDLVNKCPQWNIRKEHIQVINSNSIFNFLKTKLDGHANKHAFFWEQNYKKSYCLTKHQKKPSCFETVEKTALEVNLFDIRDFLCYVENECESPSHKEMVSRTVRSFIKWRQNLLDKKLDYPKDVQDVLIRFLEKRKSFKDLLMEIIEDMR